jgi:hypothetical protein
MITVVVTVYRPGMSAIDDNNDFCETILFIT